MAGRTAAEKALIDSELETLRFHWGDAYEIEFGDEHGWHARRRDGLGENLTTSGPDELFKMIADDYAFRPVRREDVQ